MNSTLSWAIRQSARNLGIRYELAELIYKSYWKFIKDTIHDLNLEEMTEEEFSKTATNFNIPYIGKLFTSYDKVRKYNRKVKYLEKNVKVKGNQAPVQPTDSD